MRSADSASKKKIRLAQLADILVNDMHIKRNDFILVHASMSNINLVDATLGDFIFLLKMLVGVDGALLLPALSYDSQKKNSENKSGTSEERNPLNELFSKMSDTVQLKNHSGSYTVWGKLTKGISVENVKVVEEPGSLKLLKKTEEKNVKILGIGVSMTAYPNMQYTKVFDKYGIAFFLG